MSKLYKMVNTEKFTKRLEIILQEYELTAASFAQKINVGRATISHILSGRNKPSLDFALKVIYAFPEVDLYWLLLGQGSFPKQVTTSTPFVSSHTLQKERDTPLAKEPPKIPMKETQKITTHKKINKIVIFYTDNSFESYEN